jgi:hypothetical protein
MNLGREQALTKDLELEFNLPGPSNEKSKINFRKNITKH